MLNILGQQAADGEKYRTAAREMETILKDL